MLTNEHICAIIDVSSIEGRIQMKKRGKKIVIIIVAVVVALIVIGSLSTDDESNGDNYGGEVTSKDEIEETYQHIESAKKEEAKNLINCNVEIESCRLASDYTGKPIVIVKYIFTNKIDEPRAFSYSVEDGVFQNGVGLNKCYFAVDSANYSTDNQYKEIKKGATLDVEVAYELNDTETNIEVEVSEYFSFTDRKVTKIFSIK